MRGNIQGRASFVLHVMNQLGVVKKMQFILILNMTINHLLALCAKGARKNGLILAGFLNTWQMAMDYQKHNGLSTAAELFARCYVWLESESRLPRQGHGGLFE